jgi:serine/threonine protein phosphatase PrpC
MKYYAFSDIGRGRSRNEDSIAIYDKIDNGSKSVRIATLFAVADGIGGHTCGDIASDLACRHLKRFFDGEVTELDAAGSVRRIEQLIFAIDKEIRRRGKGDPGCEHMGTTLSILLLTRSFGVIAHVGDSRIYQLRNGTLSQLTCDHTFVQEMIDEGELSPEQAATHPFRNVLTRAVGTGEPLEKVDTGILTHGSEDRYLLSSDGLHQVISNEDMATAVNDHSDPESAGKALLDRALQADGRDNITGIVIHL